MAGRYDEGWAEAINNMAFVHIARMEYARADSLLDLIVRRSDCQTELLVAYVQKMRLQQRRSQNLEFYEMRELALKALSRLDEERQTLTSRQCRRLVYAESELAIVTSTFYYYLGFERQSSELLYAVTDEVERDTAQYLNLLYNKGAGGVILSGTQQQISQKEFECLVQCYQLAQEHDYPFFVANSLEAIAELLVIPVIGQQLVDDNRAVIDYVSNQHGGGSLAESLAERALEGFCEYGDVYQIAGAYRTLAACYRSYGDYISALVCLQQSLSDTLINQAPDLVASIREQLSVAYSAIDDKQMSDYNRNLYLDVQKETRQDRSLEARAVQLKRTLRQLNHLLWAVVAAIVILVSLLYVFYRRHVKSDVGSSDAEMQDREDELNERLAVAKRQLQNSERWNLDQRAKVSLVNSITPFIDRLLHEAKHLEKSEPRRSEQLHYMLELAEKIDEQNDVLTHWIQLRQGQLSLQIETFRLQALFDVLAKGRRSFTMKGIELIVENTELKVKADRVLTLFMLNTLADNARKFTPSGGKVTISARTCDDNYAEISVADTGVGMDEQQLAHVFEHKIDGGHGFGLLNCKGIMEKYRKMSKIFTPCGLFAESVKGKGSRFFFKLPQGVAALLMVVWFSLQPVCHVSAAGQWSTMQRPDSTDYMGRAYIYSDSAFFSNVNGCYQKTLVFADSCRICLNKFYLTQRPNSADTMSLSGSTSARLPEVEWFLDSIPANYDIILDIRNECAVAALALHQWQLYSYNNRAYIQLYKVISADPTLDSVCRTMQQSQANMQIAIMLLVLMFIAIIVAVAWQVIISLNRSANRYQEYLSRLEMTEDLLQQTQLEDAALHVSNAVMDNTLSTLKHETMYYPGRIRQLIENGDTEPLVEVVAYYRELYTILSQQSNRQTEKLRLRLRPLDNGILGDENLIGYMFEILKKQAGGKPLDVAYKDVDDRYVECTVVMHDTALTESQAALLFTPSTDNIPFLLCRQIVRDHGEATNRRACGMRAEQKDGETNIIITLPSVWKSSK